MPAEARHYDSPQADDPPYLPGEIWLCRESGLANHSGVKPAEQTKAIEEARRAGIDLDLLDSNLALSPEERVLRHESALELVRALREAGAAFEKELLTAKELRAIAAKRAQG